MKQHLENFSLKYEYILTKCGNTSAIEIKHHFIRDHMQNQDIKLEFMNSKNKLADIFIKPLNEETFYMIVRKLGIK